jgi:hypothetical protein
LRTDVGSFVLGHLPSMPSIAQPVTNFKRSNRLYYRYKSLDRDKDGIACEKL